MIAVIAWRFTRVTEVPSGADDVIELAMRIMLDPDAQLDLAGAVRGPIWLDVETVEAEE